MPEQEITRIDPERWTDGVITAVEQKSPIVVPLNCTKEEAKFLLAELRLAISKARLPAECKIEDGCIRVWTVDPETIETVNVPRPSELISGPLHRRRDILLKLPIDQLDALDLDRARWAALGIKWTRNEYLRRVLLAMLPGKVVREERPCPACMYKQEHCFSSEPYASCADRHASIEAGNETIVETFCNCEHCHPQAVTEA